MSWPTFWQKKTWQTRLLQPLGALTCWVAARRLARFRAHPPEKSLPVAVVVVGNLVVGGSGKTPFIQWLASVLTEHQIRYGIVSRGYGGKSSSWPQRVTAESDPRLVGDEPVLLAKTLGCPIAVAPKRVEAVQALANESLDVIISDDGLQHFALARDIEIVMMDAARGLGNGLCLPAGPLREPATRMHQVDFVVYNGGDFQQWVMNLHPICFRQVKDPNNSLPLTAFQNLAVFAIAGIGNPERFFQTLRDLEIQPQTQAFADHQAYRPQDFAAFDSEKPLIMTEKDAVKCKHFAQEHWWYLQVAPQCSSALATALLKTLNERKYGS